MQFKPPTATVNLELLFAVAGRPPPMRITEWTHLKNFFQCREYYQPVFSQFYRFQPRFQHLKNHLRRSANHSGSPTSSNDRFLLDNEWVRYIISHCNVSIRPRKDLARNGKELHIHVHDLTL